MVQHRHYLLAYTTCAFLLPTLVPVLGWGEPLLASFLAAVLRYVAVLHFTWLVNSAAHMYIFLVFRKYIFSFCDPQVRDEAV